MSALRFRASPHVELKRLTDAERAPFLELERDPDFYGLFTVGLLRPDKFVAYFTARQELDAAAEALRGALAGCDAHGVPFSAALDERGLLSWGVDPPDEERALRWLGRDSWRIWLARRLGSALSIAKAARTPAAVEPWLFAVERARRHGVDVRTWTPSAALWTGAAR